MTALKKIVRNRSIFAYIGAGTVVVYPLRCGFRYVGSLSNNTD